MSEENDEIFYVFAFIVSLAILIYCIIFRDAIAGIIAIYLLLLCVHRMAVECCKRGEKDD